MGRLFCIFVISFPYDNINNATKQRRESVYEFMQTIFIVIYTTSALMAFSSSLLFFGMDYLEVAANIANQEDNYKLYPAAFEAGLLIAASTVFCFMWLPFVLYMMKKEKEGKV